MKKLLYIIVPSIIIFLVDLLLRADKSILAGLYLVFPLTFIIQGIIYSNFKRELIIGFTLSSIAFIIPINLWYSMGSCIGILIIYNILGITSFFIKNIIKYTTFKN